MASAASKSAPITAPAWRLCRSSSRSSLTWMLAGVMGHLGELTIKNGVISAAFVWFGFVITTLVVNNTFGMRSAKLIVIDGGHWLAVLLLMGAIIGAWGV